MKKWIFTALFIANALFFNTAIADETAPAQAPQKRPVLTEIPTEEKPFVESINQFSKARIIELLGEPAKADDVKVKGSGKVVASIWHYHNINTDENGAYYPTTELDFIGDKVVQVVFLNNDGSETAEGKKYEVQPTPEMEKLEEIPATE